MKMQVVAANTLNSWLVAEPLLSPALEHEDRYGIKDLCVMFIQGTAQLLLAFDEDDRVVGAMMVSVARFPLTTKLDILAFGAAEGQKGAWMALWPDLQKYARSFGCRSIIGGGRPGWARKLGAIETISWEAPL